MIRPTCHGIVLFLPIRRIWAALPALVWGPILNADLMEFVPTVFLIMSPTCLLEEVPDQR